MTHDAGFTLVEWLVAVLLALVVSTLAASAYLFMARTISLWQEEVHLENTFHTVMTRISEDLYDAFDIVRRPDSTFTLARAAGDTIRFVLRSGVLYRNDRAMNDFSAVASLNLSRKEDGDGLRHFEFLLTLSSRRKTISSTLRILQRHPEPWSRQPWPVAATSNVDP